jgi:hypothetical protein
VVLDLALVLHSTTVVAIIYLLLFISIFSTVCTPTYCGKMCQRNINAQHFVPLVGGSQKPLDWDGNSLVSSQMGYVVASVMATHLGFGRR